VSLESDDTTQFGGLMEAYAGPIRRLCAVYAVSRADREDLFQDIFFAVWRAWPGRISS
jgi:DNA-directed RNA polymerase specialized sigma24 family protein